MGAWYFRTPMYYSLYKVHTTREQDETFVLRGQMAQANSTFHLTVELNTL